MTGHIAYQDCQETYEYHGNVAIERIRLQDGTVARDWLYFDSTEEAVEFFNDVCA
jgi:endonuclease I